MIKPTVGRKVWYRPTGHMRTVLCVSDDSQPCDATVIYVWGDRMVNLQVVGPTGITTAVRSATLLQDGDAPPAGSSYAEWPPHQVASAPAASQHPVLAGVAAMNPNAGEAQP